MDAEREEWLKILSEVEALSVIHQDALCNIDKCREFGARLSSLLSKLEDMGKSSLADRVMDILAGCSPKTASHCENAERTKGALERLHSRVKDQIQI